MTAEERYDIECQIDALCNEADYCDDHNDPNRAVAARNEATELRKKLDAEDTKECFSEDYTDEDPFDVDWDETDEDNLQEDALITEDLCVFRVNFNKIPDDFKEFKSEEEAIKFAKDNLSDEPHIFKKCGDKEPEEIASYQDWTYGVREELEADAKALDVEEDYTGNPEERTDHLDYVDDNPTDDKFKFPKNITKKEDDHCKKSNPVVNHDPDDKDILKEDWRDDVGLAPMWCCKSCKDLYEYMKDHPDADAKDKTFAKLARESIKKVRQKYGVSNQEAADIIAKGQALYKHLFEDLVENSNKTLNEGILPRGAADWCCDNFKDFYELLFGADNSKDGKGIDKFAEDAAREIMQKYNIAKHQAIWFLLNNGAACYKRKHESLKESTGPAKSSVGFSFEKGDSVVNKYEAWADVYVKAQSGGEILITVDGPIPDEVDDCFYLDISGGWSKYDNRDVGLGYDWEFECNGVYVDPGPIDRALNCFGAKLQKLENADPVDITVEEACQILQVSPDTLAVIIADAKKEVLQQFMEDYEDYIYDNIYDFVEYDSNYYDD